MGMLARNQLLQSDGINISGVLCYIESPSMLELMLLQFKCKLMSLQSHCLLRFLASLMHISSSASVAEPCDEREILRVSDPSESCFRSKPNFTFSQPLGMLREKPDEASFSHEKPIENWLISYRISHLSLSPCKASNGSHGFSRSGNQTTQTGLSPDR